MASFSIRLKERSHIHPGIPKLIKELLREPVKEVILTLFMILARCHNPAEFSNDGAKLLDSIRRNRKDFFPIVQDVCRIVYGNAFDPNAPAAVAELIIENFASRRLRELIPGAGSLKSGGPAKIENMQGIILDTDETGTGEHDFDVVWYKSVNQKSRDILAGWGIEIKLRVESYINKQPFERKLRYMQFVSDTVSNWESKVVTVRTIGSTFEFSTYAVSVCADRVELVSVSDLYNTVYG